ncbi:OLC1v1021156C2 [Oldenlandia corymbosa var. corymbosa]|nr:OLC1v1021156C2 [Oldenlandia corymbosa var. corymbosa]
MEMDSGKLFVGGISWDTNEDRLREYFQSFGEVVEAVIMKDRNTGRARGFGFVVFADAYVAEKVVKEKHVIDGRTVEAKKAVPRDDQNNLSKSNGSNQGSPGPVRTKKIFVGGLASTVNESDFKKYFEQFGTITDVVVMYDHNTKRPRGFGFITYNSEEAVDRVLLKTFHELNGKMVEVKRAVPKELSPGPTRSPLGGYNHGLNRVNNFLNAFPQGYNPSPIAGYGVRMDGRFSPVTVGRSGYLPFSSSNYTMGPNLDSSLSEFGGSGTYSPNIGYGRSLNPIQNAYSNRFNSPVGYGVGIGGSGSLANSNGRNMWGNGSMNYDTKSANPNDFIGTGNGTSELLGAFGNIGALWGSSHGSGQGGGSASYGSNYGNGDDSFMAGGVGYGKVSGSSNMDAMPSSYASRSDSRDNMGFGNLYGRNSVYDDPTWQSSSSPDVANTGNFSYRLGDATSNVTPNSSVGYVGGYSVANRTNRGIAA